MTPTKLLLGQILIVDCTILPYEPDPYTRWGLFPAVDQGVWVGASGYRSDPAFTRATSSRMDVPVKGRLLARRRRHGSSFDPLWIVGSGE